MVEYPTVIYTHTQIHAIPLDSVL